MIRQARTAVIGCGKFGGYHAEKHAALPNAELVAVADCDAGAAEALAARCRTRAVSDHRALLGQVDAVSITVPTVRHFAVARDFLDAGADVLVEKPITGDLGEARTLVALARSANRILQVGHLERFSAVTRALKARIDRPYFIDAVRASPFHGRGTDVSVVLDLMIHDLDLVLWFVGAPIADVTASGRCERSDHADFAEARITFANGTVARLVASRVHPAVERRMRVFQPTGVLTADFAGKALCFDCVRRESSGRELSGREKCGAAAGEGAAVPLADAAGEDPVLAEIAAFLDCVERRSAPAVTGADGLSALQAALAVEQAMANGETVGFDAEGRGGGDRVQCVS